ncbi:TetR family transcriptional regulator [Mycolicibacterium setense]|uniref:TetR/AcrR family transcriptional regulator n=1 Tax=Mycolicibacterium setense TaxID=431269 RepID=UPI0007EB6992|nr:TetR family transcriptional regulator [Mycolicibacterium setense]OBB17677.1 TetR family transcriptional regulator [Mycolicibacterium setense]
MARPRVPLISKRKVLEAALTIIDSEGLDALSIRALARRLDINGASLYHHFANKEQIIAGAARLALDETVLTPDEDKPWRVWVLRNNRVLRQAFRDHPDLVPIVLKMGMLQIAPTQIDQTTARLRQEGVPVGAIIPMMDALERFAIGSALAETGNGYQSIEHLPEEYQTQNLRDVFDNRALTADEVFDKISGQIIDSIVATAAEREAEAPAQKPAVTKRRTPARKQ